MHLISTNCLKDPTLPEPTYDAAILSENMNSQVVGSSGTSSAEQYLPLSLLLLQ